MTPEAVVKRGVKQWLNAHRIWYFMPPANGFGKIGVPDFVCCMPVTITPEMVGHPVGLFVGIETKAPGKLRALTANQKARHEEIKDAHGIVLTVDDVVQLGALPL